MPNPKPQTKPPAAFETAHAQAQDAQNRRLEAEAAIRIYNKRLADHQAGKGSMPTRETAVAEAREMLRQVDIEMVQDDARAAANALVGPNEPMFGPPAPGTQPVAPPPAPVAPPAVSPKNKKLDIKRQTVTPMERPPMFAPTPAIRNPSRARGCDLSRGACS